ncbi:MAG: C40 family peptidase [Paludibacterium sp.]|uniref:C40 family peptidase n=1 Tax=Paludibacterium sp. TaxID=1917523 RepID=UPI0025F4C638|nr:C40 family peptidase [Paludibacterium sp.]MBV8048292.1 C40 family peptidase [Paludibacterium sp.]MBV8646461.1 C40 family peptidase [Paludibacterium sp.]
MMRRTCAVLLILLLAACSSPPPLKQRPWSQSGRQQQYDLSHLQADGAGREILMYTLSLLDVGYQFGGSNPAAGLDCSGMVSYIYLNAVGVRLPHNAAQIANLARPIDAAELRVGDLVFFNTLNRPFSHMGIYIGDGKFVHAPHTNSVIRIDRLDNRYFAAHFEGGRTLFS